jgi:hypothetical protein
VHWDVYTVFAVLSGVVAMLGGLAFASRPRDRLWGVLGGAALIAYGVYVAGQTSGTYYFPVQMFVIAPVGVAALVWHWFTTSAVAARNRPTGPPRTSAHAPPPLTTGDQRGPAPTTPPAHRAAANPADVASSNTGTIATPSASARPAPIAPPRGVFCQECGIPTSVADRFCGSCGEPQPTARVVQPA